MTAPKRHHFLPEFYQHGFTSNGFLWLFDRETGQYRHEQPVNTAVIGHYYSVEMEDGTKDPRIERFLADVIESDAKPIIGKLDDGEPISGEEKDALANFASFLYFRVPRFQRFLDEMIDGAIKALTPLMVQSPDDLRRDLAECPDLTDEQRKMPPELLYEFMKSGEYSVKVTKEFRLDMMLSQAVQIQNLLRQMQWAVVHTPEDSAFLTTDDPVVIIPPADYPPTARSTAGFLTPGAKKILPLTARTCLIMADRGDDVVHAKLSKATVCELNMFVVAGCERFVIGRDEAHVRSLVAKTRVDRVPKQALVHVG